MTLKRVPGSLALADKFYQQAYWTDWYADSLRPCSLLWLLQELSFRALTTETHYPNNRSAGNKFRLTSCYRSTGQELLLHAQNMNVVEGICPTAVGAHYIEGEEKPATMTLKIGYPNESSIAMRRAIANSYQWPKVPTDLGFEPMIISKWQALSPSSHPAEQGRH